MQQKPGEALRVHHTGRDEMRGEQWGKEGHCEEVQAWGERLEEENKEKKNNYQLDLHLND